MLKAKSWLGRMWWRARVRYAMWRIHRRFEKRQQKRAKNAAWWAKQPQPRYDDIYFNDLPKEGLE